MANDYADDAWHVIVSRWRYDTDQLDMASEGEATTAAASGVSVQSPDDMAFGRKRFAALGCQIAFFASCSGTQVHSINLQTLAQSVYNLLIPDIA